VDNIKPVLGQSRHEGSAIREMARVRACDTVRFYALRLYEDGLIKSTPQKILAQGTDWRFFNELKTELEG
jgi:hypothetical protein